MKRKIALLIVFVCICAAMVFVPACGGGENSVNGAPIGNYSIVYAESNSVNKQIAKDLANGIRKKCGVTVNVISDSQNVSGRKIFVGKSQGVEVPDIVEGKFSISTCGNDVLLYSGKTSGIVDAASCLLRKTFEGTADFKNAYTDVYTDMSLKVMSFNIRTTNEDRWDRIKNVIQRNNPDVLGLQEVSRHWQPYIKEKIEGYTCIGVGRDGGNPQGAFGDEAVYVLYKTEKFELIEQNTYWYNEKDITEFGITQGGMYPRIFTYAILKRKSDGEKFLYINTHMHLHVECRLIAAEILNNFIYEKGDGLPVYITGDFNTEWDQTNNSIIVPGEHDDIDTELEFAGFMNARKYAAVSDNHRTFPSRLYPADAARWGEQIIDYCMYREGGKISVVADSYKVDAAEPDGVKDITDSAGNKCGPDASDHYPVVVESVFYKRFG